MKIIIIIAIVILILYTIIMYNSLQKQKQSIREAYSNILVALKKKVELTNQIIDIAKGYGTHENLTHVSLSGNIEGAIEQLSALAQNYPELKANQTYQKLMDQLESLENTISKKRETYNRIVKQYNSYRSAFPSIIIAKMINFGPEEYYNEDEDILNKTKSFN